MVVEMEEWDGGHTIKEENLSSFDAVPLCIKIVSYAQPCKNLWANRTFLKVVGTSLENFRAQVPFSPPAALGLGFPPAARLP